MTTQSSDARGSTWFAKTPSGTPRRWPSGRFRCRGKVLWPDGKRQDFAVPEINCSSEEIAADYVAEVQAGITAGGMALVPAKAEPVPMLETVDQWFDRYLPTMICGEGHRRITGNVWNKWVSPQIGTKPISTLTRDDLEDVRDRLDRALDAGLIRATTPRNAWSAVTGAMKAASASRDRTLRVHATPLHIGILPPKREPSRQRPWLYPSEWIKLATCEAVPVERRQLYAIALYTGLRPNELRVLQWSDVDACSKQISVSKAWDEETKTAKAPKTTAAQRTIPIEATLLPARVAMRGKADGAALVAPLLSSRDDRHAATFRDDLVLAGVTRPRLAADTATEEPADFRSLRDSYATWLALADVADKRIQRRLGHASNLTTDRYIKVAESFDIHAIGLPFPMLPPLLAWPSDGPSDQERARSIVARVGFEPTTFGL